MEKDTKFLVLSCVEFVPAPLIPHKKVSLPPGLETIAEEEAEEHQEFLSQLAIAFQFFLSGTISQPTGVIVLTWTILGIN